jgi:hypothetical protein
VFHRVFEMKVKIVTFAYMFNTNINSASNVFHKEDCIQKLAYLADIYEILNNLIHQ